MSHLRIVGGHRLEGRVRAGGRKNSAVAVLPATLLVEGQSVIENLPGIDDVRVYRAMLEAMGSKLRSLPGGGLAIDHASVREARAPYDLARKLRASYYLLGAGLGRFGAAEVALPGGCDIGPRPIDQHLKGLRALGAEVEIEGGVIRARAPHGLVGAPIYLDVVTVGGTINIMLAAVLAEGTTVIENAAKEPHIVDVATYLNACGARVQGAGTDMIRIHGVKRLAGAQHAIIPDELEAATFMIAAAATRGEVTVENVITKHLEPVTAKLRESGAEVEENGDWVRVRGPERPRAVNLKTLPYPGFPTDAMPQMATLLARAQGTSVVTEGLWDGRFRFVSELKRMGASIHVDGRTAIIEGVERLTASPVAGTDLRATAALVIAALMSDGETVLEGLEYLDRGYDRLEARLTELGAEITRIDATEPLLAPEVAAE